MSAAAVSSKSVLGETFSWFKTGDGLGNLALKPLQYALEIVKESGANNRVTDHILSDVKLARKYLAAPELAGHIYSFSSALAEGDVAEAVLETISAVDPAFKLVSLADHYGEFLSDSAAEGLKVAGAGALLTGQTWGAVKNISELVNSGKALEAAADPKEIDLEKARIVHSSLGLAKKIVNIALAAIILVGVIFAIAFSPWIGLALSVTALVLTIATFFADKSLGYAARKGNGGVPLPTDFFKGADWAKAVGSGDETSKAEALRADLAKRYKAMPPEKQAEFLKKVPDLAANSDLQAALSQKEAAVRQLLEGMVAAKFDKQAMVLADVERDLRLAAGEEKGDKLAAVRKKAAELTAHKAWQDALVVKGSTDDEKVAAAAKLIQPVVDKILAELTKK